MRKMLILGSSMLTAFGVVVTPAYAANVAASVPASAPQGVEACVYQVLTSVSGRSAGFKGTSETSKQVAGPGTINYTETAAASHAFGTSLSATVDANAIIAKASATFGISYTYTSTSTKAWGYSTSIPAGKTGLMAVLHRTDRDGFSQVFKYEDCTTRRVDAYAYIPWRDTANVTYCIIRDLSPYGYSAWRNACAGE